VTFALKMEDKCGLHFQSDKARMLGKVDLSRKGSVDESIRDLVEYINAQDSFYTTSSCSGRVTVFSEVCRSANKFSLQIKRTLEDI
jgi:tRNA wybutosine-synthesizing protein 3